MIELDPLDDFPEDRNHEQLFFAPETTREIISRVQKFSNIAFLCCPSLSLRPEFQNREDVTFFDIDTRFPRVTYFDLRKPIYPGRIFDVVVFDPPFFTTRLVQLRRAVRMLQGYDDRKGLLMTYLARREATFLRYFDTFHMRRIGEAQYNSVQIFDRNRTIIYANFGKDGAIL